MIIREVAFSRTYLSLRGKKKDVSAAILSLSPLTSNAIVMLFEARWSVTRRGNHRRL